MDEYFKTVLWKIAPRVYRKSDGKVSLGELETK